MKPFIILSYPRSGNTLMRYIIEKTFNVRTYGYNTKIDISPVLYQMEGYRGYDLDWIGYKRHNEARDLRGDEPLILILRDKQKAMDSHYQKESIRHEIGDINVWNIQQSADWEENAHIYERWKGRKAIIDFNDLITGHANIAAISYLLQKKQVNDLPEDYLQTVKEFYDHEESLVE